MLNRYGLGGVNTPLHPLWLRYCFLTKLPKLGYVNILGSLKYRSAETAYGQIWPFNLFHLAVLGSLFFKPLIVKRQVATHFYSRLRKLPLLYSLNQCFPTF